MGSELVQSGILTLVPFTWKKTTINVEAGRVFNTDDDKSLC